MLAISAYSQRIAKAAGKVAPTEKIRVSGSNGPKIRMFRVVIDVFLSDVNLFAVAIDQFLLDEDLFLPVVDLFPVVVDL